MRCVRENDICMRVRVTYDGFVHLGFQLALRVSYLYRQQQVKERMRE